MKAESGYFLGFPMSKNGEAPKKEKLFGGFWSGPSFISAKKQQVLPRQILVGVDQLEAIGGVFFETLRFAHFMVGFDGNLGVLGAEFDQGNPSVRFQALANLCEHLGGVRKFVVHINEEEEVDLALGKFGVGLGTEDGFDDAIGRIGCFSALFEQLEHLRLDVDGEYGAVGADEFREPQSVVAVSATEVANGDARGYVEGPHHDASGLFGLARSADQPRRTFKVHGVGYLSAEILWRRGLGEGKGAKAGE